MPTDPVKRYKNKKGAKNTLEPPLSHHHGHVCGFDDNYFRRRRHDQDNVFFRGINQLCFVFHKVIGVWGI